MSVITTSNHPKLLWPGIKAIWGRKYAEHQTEFTDLFDEDTSDKAYEEDVEATGFGLAPVKPQGSSIAYDSESQGTVTRYTHIAYALGYIVPHEELMDNKYEEVSRRRAAANAFSMRQTLEIVAANIYNRGFNSSYTYGDGKELFATDHPTLDGTQSNELAVAADLSQAAIEDLLIQIMNAKNSRGMRIKLMPQSLHVPPQLVFEARRILMSELQSDTAENAVNVLKGQFPKGVKVNHYFDDSDAWFIRTNAPRGQIHYEREKIQFFQDNDFDTRNAKAASYMRHSFGSSDFRGAYASQGA
jgi:hypothetical protein